MGFFRHLLASLIELVTLGRALITDSLLIGWHRAGFRLFWRWKCRVGRPRLPEEPRVLIRQMGRDNISWGEEHIANEILLNLWIQAPRTVRIPALKRALVRRAMGLREPLPRLGRGIPL